MESKLEPQKFSADDSPILNFYKGKSIFITGGTGFLGMVIIEKLLFACNDIKNIYMLIKPKHGKSVQDRLSFLDTEAFRRIKAENKEKLKKLIPIAGDLIGNDIGLSDADIKTLQKEVSVVFHVAASINVDLPLKDAIKINTQGTENIVQLCKSMQQLEVFVYVSTAYSNSNRKVIEEKVYATDYPLQSVHYTVDESNVASMIRELIGGRPNTYTYSKALAEEIVANELHEVPVAIIRPSIITGAIREPVQSWVHGWSGGHSIISACGKGTIRCWNGDPDAVCDIIPVDTVANLTVVAAWDVVRRREAGKNQVKVFNCCSGLQNPITVGKLLWTDVVHARKHFVREVIVPPMLLIIKPRWLYLILSFIIQTIPVYFWAGLEYLFLREHRMLNLHRKQLQLGAVLDFFTTNQFLLIDYNVRQLNREMAEKDRKLFDFDVKNIHWDDYIESYVLGIKRFLLKEA